MQGEESPVTSQKVRPLFGTENCYSLKRSYVKEYLDPLPYERNLHFLLDF